MTECMDVLIYIMGSVQMLAGFYFLTRFLQKKVRFYLYGLRSEEHTSELQSPS